MPTSITSWPTMFRATWTKTCQRPRDATKDGEGQAFGPSQRIKKTNPGPAARVQTYMQQTIFENTRDNPRHFARPSRKSTDTTGHGLARWARVTTPPKRSSATFSQRNHISCNPTLPRESRSLKFLPSEYSSTNNKKQVRTHKPRRTFSLAPQDRLSIVHPGAAGARNGIWT